MSQQLDVFAQRYAAALRRHTQQAGEESLQQAYELGRSACAGGLSVLDLAAVHHRVLLELLAGADPARAQHVGELATAFHLESLSTYEMAQRGFQEAHETARFEREHARALRGLAEAAVAINATREPGALLELVAHSARELTGARLASIEVRLDDREDTVLAARSELENSPAPADVTAEVAIAAPLIGPDGRRFGELQLSGKEDGELSTSEDAIVTQLAQMVAVALENRRLYEREHRIAHTLQQSLLPKRLPRVPGLRLAARYLAAGEGNEVGGDFYDVVGLPDGHWLLLIGDVCGKGPDAAAVTARARYTARAAARPGRRPGEILAELNGSMLDDPTRPELFTMACALLTAPGGAGSSDGSGDGDGRHDDATLELALGGHPRPLVLRADGTVEEGGEPGTLLGAVADPALPDARVRLAPGDTIVFYTDGVTDAGAPGRMWTPFDVAAALRGAARRGAEATAEQLERAVLDLGRGTPRDDIAILVAQVPRRRI